MRVVVVWGLGKGRKALASLTDCIYPMSKTELKFCLRSAETSDGTGDAALKKG